LKHCRESVCSDSGRNSRLLGTREEEEEEEEEQVKAELLVKSDSVRTHTGIEL